MGKAYRWASIFTAALALPLPGTVVAADPPSGAAAQKTLETKGLRRLGTAFVLPTELEVRSALAQLGDLVSKNQREMRRRGLRSLAAARSQSLLADLQGWRLALNSLNSGAASPPPSYLANYPGPLLLPDVQRSYLDQQIGLNNQQIDGMFRVVAGIQADNAYEAAEALARQDDFAHIAASIAPAVDRLTAAYSALRADTEVAEALGVVTRAENRPATLGPVEDYAGKIDDLAEMMAGTRLLTNPPGSDVPDYTIASLLINGARLNLRQALGRWEDARAKPGATPESLAPFAKEVGARVDRYVRSVALLRRAYDGYQVRPAPVVLPIEKAAPVVPGSIRAKVEAQRAKLRKAYVTEAEDAIADMRLPLDRDADGAAWLSAAPTAPKGAPVRFRLDFSRERIEARLPTTLAKSLALPETEPGRRTILKGLRLDRFTVENLRVVIDPADAAPVLPLGALARLAPQADLDAKSPSLVVTEVNVPAIRPRPLPPGAPPPKVRTKR